MGTVFVSLLIFGVIGVCVAELADGAIAHAIADRIRGKSKAALREEVESLEERVALLENQINTIEFDKSLRESLIKE